VLITAGSSAVEGTFVSSLERRPMVWIDRYYCCTRLDGLK
jgi:hypothetical protein